MAASHPQAYLRASKVIAASPGLDPARLDLPDPGGDALLAVEVAGLGRVAARVAGDFTHVVARAGIEHWDAPFWRADGVELEALDALPPGPLDLRRAAELLADAPEGVREAVIDAALAGPLTVVDDDPQRRAAWIAWAVAAVPDATFTTFAARPIGVRVTATTRALAGAFPDALDTARPIAAPPSRSARIAAAVAGGATDLLTPEDLPRALELITALVRRGEIAAAARAAAGLGADPVHEETELGMPLSELEAALARRDRSGEP